MDIWWNDETLKGSTTVEWAAVQRVPDITTFTLEDVANATKQEK